MRHTWLKTAALAIVSFAASAFMAHAESLAIRNCTWCHGASAQGYTPAPRLAGQRVPYMENQLISFRAHTRDNPFSKQYMWGAARNLSPRAVHELAIYFSSLPADAANDGDRELDVDRENDLSTGTSGREYCRLRRVSWPECRGRCRNSSFGRSGLHLPEKAAATMGRGLSRDRAGTDAPHCQQTVPRSNRGAGVLPQLHQVDSNGHSALTHPAARRTAWSRANVSSSRRPTTTLSSTYARWIGHRFEPRASRFGPPLPGRNC